MVARRFFAAFGATFVALCGLPCGAIGAGFALREQSVSGLGNAFAGGAAVAEDATTVSFNPAGMALIEKPQLSGGAHFIVPNARFENQGTTTLGVPTQGDDSTSDEAAIVPNLYYVAPLSDDLVWGVGLSVPFGLVTDYGDDWVGRYIARETELMTVMLNPSLAYRVSAKLSIGGGISYTRGDAVLSNAIDMGLVFLNQFQSGGIPATPQTAALAGDIQANLGGTKYDGSVRLEGDGDGWGFNLGLIYEVSESLRWGVHYRSGVSLDLKGSADFEVGALEAILGPAFLDQGGFVDLDLPDTFSLSVYSELSDRWSLMADVTRTGWSSFEYLTIRFETPSPPTSVTPEKWEDADRYSVGASYRFSDKLTGRFGLAYDDSPVPDDGFRTPRIPDESRTWLSFGLSFAVSEKTKLHAAFTHIFLDDPKIHNVSHSAGQRLLGKMEARADLLSFGFDRTF